MGRGTEASGDTADLLAKQIARALGITPGHGHDVAGIAKAIIEA